MKFFLKHAAALFLGALLTLSGSASAQETPKVGERIGDWTFNCRALSADQNVCGVSQGLTNAETKQQVMSLTLQKDVASGTPFLSVVLPLGIYLGEDAVGKVDGTPVLQFIWQLCTAQGCQAIAGLSSDAIAAFKRGNKLEIQFKARQNADPLQIAASLTGMTKSMNALDIR